MIRKYICIGFFLAISFNAFSYFDYEDFFSLDRETRGIKKMTEYQRNIAKFVPFFNRVKVVSFFDEEGFLLRETRYRKNNKNKMYVEHEYEYSVSDTLLVIKEKYRYPNDGTEGFIIYKHYYNSLKQCYRFEIFFPKDLDTPAVFGDNFIYEDNQIQSYEWSNFFDTTIYKYFYTNDGNQITKKDYFACGDSICGGCDDILIYKNGKLTDFIQDGSNVSGTGTFVGVPCWDKTLSKVHIRYSNFDKRGNWTRSYYLTERGKFFRSKRKIEYW